jgi:hypothetical protein
MGNTTKPSTEHINSVMNESVAEQRAKATIETVKKEFEADDALRYLKNDSFSAGPASLLGKIFYEKEGEPTLKRWALSITPKVDEASVLKEPITRMELIVENKVAANIEFLSFLSSGLSSDEIYEVKVIDNAVVRLVDHGEEWEKCLISWMQSPFNHEIINDPKVKSIGIVTGVVQKFIISKKYKKFDASVKGGAYGVNVGGELYTSTTEYSFDTRYGIDLVYLPAVKSVAEFSDVVSKGIKVQNSNQLAAINSMLKEADEKAFFESIYIS